MKGKMPTFGSEIEVGERLTACQIDQLGKMLRYWIRHCVLTRGPKAILTHIYLLVVWPNVREQDD
jgi:hypothetical protein